MELIEFNTIDLRDGEPLKVFFDRQSILGFQNLSERTKGELKLSNPGGERYVDKLKLSIIIGGGSYAFHLVTNSEKEMKECGIFEFISLKKPKAKKERLDD